MKFEEIEADDITEIMETVAEVLIIFLIVLATTLICITIF